MNFEELYTTFHSWLVRRTRAYHNLFTEIEKDLNNLDYPRNLPGLLVPSSTGEILLNLKDAASNWWGVDSNHKCLEQCSKILPDFRPLPTDLNLGWPFESKIFGLGISIHSLHFFQNPSSILSGLHNSLAPGGIAILVAFKGNGHSHEGIFKGLWRIQKEQGTFEAWNMLPWKVLDSLMLLTSSSPFHFWTKEDFTQLLTKQGFVVKDVRLTFNGCSLLAICYKEKEQ